MKPQESNHVRIGIKTQSACGITLTGISDPDATYGSHGNIMWIEAPIERKHMLISFRFSRDVSFSITLGGRSFDGMEAPSILYKKLIVNNEDLLHDEVITGTTPLIVNHKACGNQHLCLIIEWALPSVESTAIPTLVFAQKASESPVTFVQETDAEKATRLESWASLNSSLEKTHSLIQPVEYIVLESRKLVYIVNSKVANTSIKFSLADDYFDDDYSIHGAMKLQGFSKTNLTETQKDYFTFTFVRNPFSRLVSCYVSKYHTDKSVYKKEQGDFATYLDGYLSVDEGFDRFIDKICEIPYRLMDRHFRLQHDIVFDEDGRNRCDYIGKYERMDEDFKIIKDTYKLRDLPHYNTTRVHNWMDFYTESSAEKVFEKYRPDFESFDYSQEYESLLNYINR